MSESVNKLIARLLIIKRSGIKSVGNGRVRVSVVELIEALTKPGVSEVEEKVAPSKVPAPPVREEEKEKKPSSRYSGVTSGRGSTKEKTTDTED